MTKAHLQQRLRFAPADREESYYRYIPVEVPPAWPSVKVEYSFDRSLAAIDLGLLGPGGFRGWSGGARSSATVAASWATPGYLPGELTGEWSVMLGLYRLPPSGLDIVVTVGPGDPVPPPPAAWPEVPRDVPSLRRPPARAGQRWVAGDLHCHSEHSDGAFSLAYLAALARSRGLDFLALTDHNTVSHFPHLEALGSRYGLTLVPGQEVTTPLGHANAFGAVGWVDFRLPPNNWVKQAQEGGGLLSVNHPVVPVLGWQLALDLPPHLVELWHQTWDRRSAAPLEFWASLVADVGPSASLEERPAGWEPAGWEPAGWEPAGWEPAGWEPAGWEPARSEMPAGWEGPTGPMRLARRARSGLAQAVPVGGSDFHRHGEPDGTGSPRLPGNPTTWVEVPAGEGPPAVDQVIEGLRRGVVSLSATPFGPTLVRLGNELVVTGGDGARLGWLAGPPWSLGQVVEVGAAGDGITSFAAPADQTGVAVLLDAGGRVLALCP